MNDLRFALRQLLKNPGFTVVAVLTLALGIGATTALVSVVRIALFDPLPTAHPDRLLQLVARHKKQGWTAPGLNPPALREVRAQTNLFARVAAYEMESLTLAGEEFPQPVPGLRVTPEFFSLWTLRPLLGRTFAADEGRPGNDTAIILGHRAWQSRFGGDPAIVGRKVQFKERVMTVVGVMPPHFSFPTEWWEYWRPFAGPQNPAPNGTTDLGAGDWLSNTGVIAELRAGVEPVQAQSFLDVLAAQQAEASPMTREFELLARDIRELFTRPEVRRTFGALLGAVVLVLLIAAANVANLQLARTETRQQELAVRSALGAGRGRVFRQLLAESLLLAALGGAAGLVVTALGLDLLQKLVPPELPRLKPVTLDAGVLAVTSVITLASAFLFGLVPAWQGGRTGVGEVLKVGAASSTPDRRRGRFSRALIVVQVALALMLLAGAGLMMRSVRALLTVPLGIDPRGVVRVYPSLDMNRYLGDPDLGAAALDAVFADMQQRVAALPGVVGTGIALEGGVQAVKASSEVGTPTEVQEYFVGVGPADPLQMMRVPLLKGRWLERGDASQGAPRILVNDAAARRLWPGESPVGKRLWHRSGNETRSCEVVGVVGDYREFRYDLETPPTFYRVLAKAPVFGPSRCLWVRTAVPAVTLHKAIGRELKAAGADQSPPMFSDLEESLYVATAGHRTLMLYLTIFAGVGLLLAAIGLYGVLAYSVAQRTREIGIRMALGAQLADVMRLIVGDGARLVLLGLLLGLAGALASGRLLKSFLFGTSAADPVTLACVAVLLGLVGGFAAWLPARKASRIDPMVALRGE